MASQIRSRPSLSQWSSLLLSIGILSVGLGLQQSLLGVRATDEGFSALAIGLMMSGYYAGYLWACRTVPSTMAGVGAIRTFSALAAAAGMTVLAYALAVQPALWVALRVASGFCAGGQLLLNVAPPGGFELFALVAMCRHEVLQTGP